MSSTNSLSDMSLKQLNEMNSKAKRLVELMKKGIVQFVFKKKSNGKIRKAKGTLKKDLIPKESQRKSGRPKKRPDDLVIYFDVDKQEIRSFKDYLLQKVNKPLVTKKPDISKTEEDVNSSKDNKISKEKKPSSASKKPDEKKQGKENGKED